MLDNNCYELDSGCFAVYGFEYKPGFEADNGVRASYLCAGSSLCVTDRLM